MIFELFFAFFQIVEAINAQKFIIGEWQIYNKAQEISLYTIEFHQKEDTENTSNKLNKTIIGSIWSNKKDDLRSDYQISNYIPDNFIVGSFELVFTTDNEGNLKEYFHNEENDNSFLQSSHFSIKETEDKAIIVTFNSDSIKLTCRFSNSTDGTIKYQDLKNIDDGEIDLLIKKSPKFSFFQWGKFFAYAFYAIFILTFCRTILVTRSFLIQRSRENQNSENKKEEKLKETTQQNSEKNEDEKKDHPKSE